ncbi:MAG: hypothetical protein M3394_06665, partial [Actinomycetota bacterium]|nr:hypothetical protein [Actinomycetota bacterium]
VGVEQGRASLTPGTTGSAAVDCAQAVGMVAAEASVSFAPGEAAVAASSSKLTVRDDPERGRVTEVVADARGIVLGEGISVGHVRSVARAWSNGRPGGARASYQRTICDVRVAALRVDRCLAEGKEQEDFVAALNQAFRGRAKARLRTPNPGLLAGTPGGFQAAVQRSELDRFTDTVVNRDASRAVPALEIVWYRDDPSLGAGRQILQLAAVEVSSQYGIYCLSGSNAAGTACKGDTADITGLGSDATETEMFAAALLSPESKVSESASMPDLTTANVPSDRPARSLLSSGARRLGSLPNDLLRLALSHPREAGLLAVLWALIWLPCYLGERRRAASALLATRLYGGAR